MPEACLSFSREKFPSRTFLQKSLSRFVFLFFFVVIICDRLFKFFGGPVNTVFVQGDTRECGKR